MRCPRCTSRLHYSLEADWRACELCGYRLSSELIYRLSATRRGRLWLRIFTH
jgi:hypothetical protein